MTGRIEIANVTEDIAAPIQLVWKYLSDFGGLDKLYPREGAAGLPPIERIESTGKGIGAVRTIYLAGGLYVTEDLVELDNDDHVLVYTMPPPFLVPVEGYRGSVSARALSPNETRVRWRCEGRLIDTPLEEIRPNLEALYSTLIDGARSLSIADIATQKI